MREEWRDIKGHEGRYQVSNIGNVRSVDRTTIKSDGVVQRSKGKVLKKWLSSTGYWGVRIEKREHVIIHRAVAEAFLPKKEGCNVVNHKNGVRTDNRVTNLEWTTFSGNTLHGVYTTKNIKSQLLHPMRKVVCIETGKIYDSMALAAREVGGQVQNIYHVCKGTFPTAYGYHWRYVDGD